MSLGEKIKNVFAKKAVFEYEIAVEGMKCEHCSARLVTVLSKIDGARASASVPEKKIYLSAKAEIDEALVKSTVENAGEFTVVSITKK